MLRAFGILARFRFLRGSRFDLFGYSQERKMERGLIEAYFENVTALTRNLTRENYALALEIVEVPITIRGYGHVKVESVKMAEERLQQLLSRWPIAADEVAA